MKMTKYLGLLAIILAAQTVMKADDDQSNPPYGTINSSGGMFTTIGWIYPRGTPEGDSALSSNAAAAALRSRKGTSSVKKAAMPASTGSIQNATIGAVGAGHPAMIAHPAAQTSPAPTQTHPTPLQAAQTGARIGAGKPALSGTPGGTVPHPTLLQTVQAGARIGAGQPKPTGHPAPKPISHKVPHVKQIRKTTPRQHTGNQ